MLETLIFILKLSFSTFESWWRRWFGGGFIGGKDFENKWYLIVLYIGVYLILIGFIINLVVAFNV